MSAILARARDYEIMAEREITPDERPLFHLSPRTGWMNDPNGFGYYRGLYHLFYQYHPYDTEWGSMHWGHAVSRDLLTWRYLPAALAPDQEYDSFGCFSGSAEELPDGRQLILYTSVSPDRTDPDGRMLQTQSIAVGDGTEYQKFSGNPVLTAEELPEGATPYDFRDPHIWRTENRYAAVVASDNRLRGTQILQIRSADGFRWEFDRILTENRGRIGGMWECPDYFPLDGKQILLASAMNMQEESLDFHRGNNTFCMIGREGPDGTFEEDVLQTVDHGTDFYAAQTLKSPDGRRIMIGWMHNPGYALAVRGRTYTGQMTLPRELFLRDGRLCQRPIRELTRMRCGKTEHRGILLGAEEHSAPGISGRALDLTITVRAVDSKEPYRRFRCRFAREGSRYVELTYRPNEGILTLDRHAAGICEGALARRELSVRTEGGTFRVRMILDRFSAELFLEDGGKTASLTYSTPPSAGGITFSAEGDARMDIEAYRLDPEKLDQNTEYGMEETWKK